MLVTLTKVQLKSPQSLVKTLKLSMFDQDGLCQDGRPRLRRTEDGNVTAELRIAFADRVLIVRHAPAWGLGRSLGGAPPSRSWQEGAWCWDVPGPLDGWFSGRFCKMRKFKKFSDFRISPKTLQIDQKLPGKYRKF